LNPRSAALEGTPLPSGAGARLTRARGEQILTILMRSDQSLALHRRGLAPLMCALGAHAIVYRSLWPTDGLHGYFGWYERSVAAASLLSLIYLLALLLVVWLARRSGRRPRKPSAQPPRSLAEIARGLSLSSLVVLLVQESLERSLDAGSPAFAVFAPWQWLLLFVAIALTSLTVALFLALGEAAVRWALADSASPSFAARRAEPGWSVVTSGRRRPRPLAERFALRAPPLLLS
jgi:hypothetical protein